MRPALAAIAAGGLVAVAACVVNPNSPLGKSCDDQHPCVGSQVCWRGQCFDPEDFSPELCDGGECEFGTGGLLATGTYVGNGVDDRFIATSSAPAALFIKSLDTLEAYCRFSTMTGDVSKPMRRPELFQANVIQELRSDGFVVGTAPEVNQLGVTYLWVAFRNEPGQLLQNSYVGNSVADRVIDVGFRPAAVFLLNDAAQLVRMRFDSMPVGESGQLGETAFTAEGIEDFTSSGFQLGTLGSVNGNTGVFHYLAIGEAAGAVATGSYAGSAQPRFIEAGFRPGWVLVKGPPLGAISRPESLGGRFDRSLRFNLVPLQTNMVRSLDATGFSLGTGQEVNALGFDYYYLTLAR